MEFILYDKESRAIANILPAQFLIFYETHFNAKIEHEDNFFIELDSRLFWPTKITSPSWESIPRSNMSGPPPRATIFAGLARLSCKHDTVNYTPISCCTYSYSPFNRGGPDFSFARCPYINDLITQCVRLFVYNNFIIYLVLF